MQSKKYLEPAKHLAGNPTFESFIEGLEEVRDEFTRVLVTSHDQHDMNRAQGAVRALDAVLSGVKQARKL